MGTGSASTLTNWRPLADHDEVVISPGPQGGQHIWIALRGRGFDPTLPRVRLQAFRVPDGALIGALTARARFSPAPEDGSLLALAPQTLLIDDDQYCSLLPGDVRVVVSLDDGAGRCLLAERRLRVRGIDPAALEVDQTSRVRCCVERLRRCYPDAGAPSARDVSVMGD